MASIDGGTPRHKLTLNGLLARLQRDCDELHEMADALVDPFLLMGVGRCATPGCEHPAAQGCTYCGTCTLTISEGLERWANEGGVAA